MFVLSSYNASFIPKSFSLSFITQFQPFIYLSSKEGHCGISLPTVDFIHNSDFWNIKRDKCPHN